jgi:bifunctional non-homologous end joining protein LigD
MLSRARNSRGRPKNAPAGFIHPCRPIGAKQPPRGEGCAHELKQDGYRLQIHIRDGRVRLYTMNGSDWTMRYPRIVEQAARIKGSAIIDAEVVCLDVEGVANFDVLHSRIMEHTAVACAFDLMMFEGDDLRLRPLSERKTALRKLLKRSKDGIQYVEHTEGDGEEMFAAVCKLGLEGIVSKRPTSFYRSGPSKNWIKVKNPKAAAVTRNLNGTRWARSINGNCSLLMTQTFCVRWRARALARQFHGGLPEQLFVSRISVPITTDSSARFRQEGRWHGMLRTSPPTFWGLKSADLLRVKPSFRLTSKPAKLSSLRVKPSFKLTSKPAKLSSMPILKRSRRKSQTVQRSQNLRTTGS